MKNNDINLVEEALLTGHSIDELIKIKMDEEIKNAFHSKGVKLTKEKIKDIKKVPKELIFSKKAIFKKFNKSNNLISYINGMQAEALLGMQTTAREKLLTGESEAFSTDESFVKFEYTEI